MSTPTTRPVAPTRAARSTDVDDVLAVTGDEGKHRFVPQGSNLTIQQFLKPRPSVSGGCIPIVDLRGVAGQLIRLRHAILPFHTVVPGPKHWIYGHGNSA
jgi:hypothetical protein